MSNINNHGVGMNKIDLATDLQELTCEQAAAIQGGGEILLFEHPNLGGDALKLFGNGGDVQNLPPEWNDRISSAVVLSGKWELATDGDGFGTFIILEPGEYRDFTAIYGGVFNDTITSVKTTIG